MYYGIQDGSNGMALDPNNWVHVRIPPIYLTSNWPIKVSIF
jgi:hypothetical protein